MRSISNMNQTAKRSLDSLADDGPMTAAKKEFLKIHQGVECNAVYREPISMADIVQKYMDE